MKGYDVSRYQLPESLPADAEFLIARATFGTKADAQAPAHAAVARARAIPFALYHFFTPYEDPEEQFAAFFDVASECGYAHVYHDGIPWVDVESPKADGSMPPKTSWLPNLETCLSLFDAQYGDAGIYTNLAGWLGLGAPTRLRTRPLWWPTWGGARAPWVATVEQTEVSHGYDHDTCEKWPTILAAQDVPWLELSRDHEKERAERDKAC